MSNNIETIANQNPENLNYVKSIYNDNTVAANYIISSTVVYVAQQET